MFTNQPIYVKVLPYINIPNVYRMYDKEVCSIIP